LRTFQVEHFEQAHFIMARHAPFAIVVSKIARIGGISPRATLDCAAWIHR